MSRFGYLLLMWSITTAVAVGSFIYLHEETHSTIAKYHGCINWTINYIALEPYFKCNEYSEDATYELHKQEYQLHSVNEIVSYNVECLFAMIYGLGVLILIMKGDD